MIGLTLLGVPRSVAKYLRDVWEGPLGETLWKVFVSLFLLWVVYELVAIGGTVGGFVAGIIVLLLLGTPIRSIVADIWNRNWAEV